MIVHHSFNQVEIKSDVFGSSISVYGPQKGWGDDGKIEPAHIGCSTFSGDKSDTAEWLQMIGCAIYYVNKFNGIHTDIPQLDNPIYDMPYVRKDLERYKAAEQTRIAEEREARKKREERKANKS